MASLKKELAAVKASQSELRTLRSEIADLRAENQRLTTENGRLTAEARDASSSLASAQNEVKAQTAKLAAARESQKTAEVALAAVKVPVSQRNNANGAAAALGTDMAALKLKEELYSDLTGLMVLGVKNVDGEDVFDCIQTGRNGSECPTCSTRARQCLVRKTVLTFLTSTALPPHRAAGTAVK